MKKEIKKNKEPKDDRKWIGWYAMNFSLPAILKGIKNRK